MSHKNPAFDAYVAKSADFAKPILNHIRQLVHATIPDVEEEMKWSSPAFVYEGLLCGMAAFKQHCVFGFWKGSLIVDRASGRHLNDEAMGNFGRITKLSDLPPDKVLIGYLKEAKRLNDEGVKVAKQTKPKAKTDAVPPPYFVAALKKNKKALATFESFSPSHRKEYVEWITDAKTDDTRNKRLETAVAWIAEGKPRNWKYMKK